MWSGPVGVDASAGPLLVVSHTILDRKVFCQDGVAMRVLLSSALAALMLSACGAASSPASPIRSYLDNVSDGNYQKACDQLSDDAKTDVDALGINLPQPTEHCADVLRQLAASNSGDLAQAKIDQTIIASGRATVDVTSHSQSHALPANPIRLVKTTAGWKINEIDLP